MPNNKLPDDLFTGIEQADIFDAFDDKEVGLTLLADFDYQAQLAAIRSLLRLHKNDAQDLTKTIAELDALARKSKGIIVDQVIDEWLEHMQISVYQDAAHSMAAVGMLAPLFESLWHQSFDRIRNAIDLDLTALRAHPRWRLSDETMWDRRYYVPPAGRKQLNIVKGVLQLAEAVGLSDHLPPDIPPILQALFAYRNKMFHLGFEWPPLERANFQKSIAAWPSDWFAMATTDRKPWIFYLTDTFILHCLDSIDKVLSGLGAFARPKRWHT
jgi:hypothetical protein